MNFQQFAFNLSVRPAMFLTGEINYISLCNLTQGYILAEPTINIQMFLQHKYHNQFSVHWAFFILNELAAKDELKAQKILTDLLLEIANKLEAEQNNPVNFTNKIASKTTEIKTLSTRRPLLAREKIELHFLQKIQAADNLETLQSIENEVNSTPTDPELIKQLQRLVAEKKGFY